MKNATKHIVCVCNQKGGVGKTTTVHDLAYLFGTKNKTLAIDLDPQISLSIFVDNDNNMTEGVYDIRDLMIDVKNSPDSVDVTKAIHHMNGYDFIYGSQMLNNAPAEFGGFNNIQLLKKVFEKLDYEIIIVDTHPDRATINQMLYCSCTDFIIPADCDRASAEGVSEVLKDINEYKESNLTDGEVLGILQTQCDRRTSVWRVSRERLSAICEYFDVPLFDTYIRTAVDAYRCKENGLCMNEYAPNNNTSCDYRNLYKEIMKKWKAKK